MCCDGKVTNNKCDSTPMCTLGKATGNIKSCADIMAEMYGPSTATRTCPSKLPNLFVDFEKGQSGCTDSPLKANYRGPVRASANKCNLYLRVNDKGEIDNNYFLENFNSQPDSCNVQKSVEELEKNCIGQDCIPFIRKIPSKNISLIGLDFTDVDNVRRTCYDDYNYMSYVRKLNKDASQYADPYRKQICSNAKAFYIDKSK
jgi:hypothetical protein